MNIAILLSGRGSNFKAIHASVKKGRITSPDGVKIQCVISNKESAEGLRYAKDTGLQAIYVNPKNFADRVSYDKAVIKILEDNSIDLICLAGYMRIISEEFVNRYYGKIINIHPSLLPSFPGLDAQKQALNYGVKVSGCTVHFVDSGMDTGPIILQQSVETAENDTEESLSARILTEEHKLYSKAVNLFVNNKLQIKDNRVINLLN